MSSFALRLRWSWRDLRQRWVQVAAIALILSIGAGIYASLGSTGHWRRASNDASFAAGGLHDLKIRLAAGTTVPAGTLAALAHEIPAAAAIATTQERLVWPTQFEVAADGTDVLVAGEIVGTDLASTIDKTMRRDGAAPSGDEGLLEYKFAKARDLPESGTVTMVGGKVLRYSGRALSPEYFWLVAEGNGMLGEADRATMFVPVEEARALTGEVRASNDLIIDLVAGADVAAVRAQLVAAVDAAGIGADVTMGVEEPAYRLLYDDIDSDQQIWNLIAGLILAGACVAAFNLISRVVEAQRREIGIGMALGSTPAHLAIRPVLVGVQIALIGAIGGVGVGLLFANAIRSLLDDVVPLPVWRTPFQPRVFLAAFGLAFAIPLIAIAVPVWRAVRVQPVDAIRPGRAASASRGWARLATGMRWPRRSLHQYPLRNVLRAPRRTLLTALAVGAALTVLIGVFGMLDSFEHTVDGADAELVRTAPDRIDVAYGSYQPLDGPVPAAISALPGVGTVSPMLQVPAQLRRDGRDAVDVVIELLDTAHAPWSPAVRSGQDAMTGRGLLLSEKAAHDLGVEPGDQVVLHHPVRAGTSYTMADTDITVAGVHRLPLRPLAYLDVSQAAMFGLAGITNAAQVVPSPDAQPSDVQRQLFGLSGVTSATQVGTAGEAWDRSLDQYTGILRMAQAATLILVLLIAFNASSIGIDERAREHATMFAFGVRRRSVLAAAVVESTIVGILGTLGGVLGGYLVTRWIFETLLPRTIPEVGIDAYLSPGTVFTLFALGVVVVGIAPLLNIGRMRRMDIPAALRYVE